MLVRLTYASRTLRKPDKKLVSSILATSQKNNAARGVTGVLCFSDEVFLQVLEGGREEVCETYNAIVRDERHTRVLLLNFEEISERRFGGWTMGQVDTGRVNPSLLLKYAEKAVLNPFAVSGKVSLALLEELSDTASVVGRSI